MSDEEDKGLHAVRVTPELLEKLERERGPDLEYMLRDAHRPFHDPHKVYRIELSDPILRIAYSAGPPQIDQKKLH